MSMQYSQAQKLERRINTHDLRPLGACQEEYEEGEREEQTG